MDEIRMCITIWKVDDDNGWCLLKMYSAITADSTEAIKDLLTTTSSLEIDSMRRKKSLDGT